MTNPYQLAEDEEEEKQPRCQCKSDNWFMFWLVMSLNVSLFLGWLLPFLVAWYFGLVIVDQP